MLIEFYKLNNEIMALSLGKRTWNTIWLPVRAAWTVLYWWLDAVNTVVTLPKQSLEIIWNTTGQIKDVFSKAWNTWKRYNKLLNIPSSPFIAAWTAIEWAIRAVVNPSWNAITHTRDVAWNTLVNLWNSIKSTLSDKPISDFKYEHLKTNPIGTKNYVSKRQWLGDVWSKKTKELEKKVWELETDNKKFETENKTLKAQIDEMNSKLSELLAAKKEEWPKTIKPDPKKWPKEKPSWEKTWKKNEKNKTNESDENETDEETNLKEAA